MGVATCLRQESLFHTEKLEMKEDVDYQISACHILLKISFFITEGIHLKAE